VDIDGRNISAKKIAFILIAFVVQQFIYHQLKLKLPKGVPEKKKVPGVDFFFSSLRREPTIPRNQAHVHI
jgi:hypothetical protein